MITKEGPYNKPTLSPASHLAIVARLEQVAGSRAIRFTLARMGDYTHDDLIA